jgi:SPP1 family predicted phage head-tail adaptor
MKGKVNDPGEFRERITVFAPGTEVRKGGIVSKPSGSNAPSIGTWYAKVVYLTGREFYSANQTALEVEVEVTVRYKKQLTEQHFFNWQGKNYDITRITHSPCKSHTTIYATRRK